MSGIGKLLRLMLEYRSGPIATLQEALSPRQNDITLSETAYENPGFQEPAPDVNGYTGPMKKCTDCSGSGEDSTKYNSLFDVYAACSTCHGKGAVPLDDNGPQVTS